jgi:aspartate carbamoyltransferase catalytic subunit
MNKNVPRLKHILESQQFTPEILHALFEDADNICRLFKTQSGRRQIKARGSELTMLKLFYEPSTRTSFSFGLAARHLGMHVEGTDNAGEFSSVVKGETLHDTIRVCCELAPDVIVIRHKQAGSAEEAARISSKFNIPIINAGDGTGQHPTQALLDVYTISSRLERLQDLNVVVVGDLANGRTARSLVYLLAKFPKNRFVFVSPKELTMGSDLLDHLKEHKVQFMQETNLTKALQSADVVYMTRIQKERLPDPNMYEKVRGQYIITPKVMKFLHKKAILMHPLPRVDEITTSVDCDERAAYFEQVRNGLFIRMALLCNVCNR